MTIAAGGTVTWTWQANNHNSVGPGWDSGVLNTGASFQRTFSSAGSFSYTCTIHGFGGTVNVVTP